MKRVRAARRYGCKCSNKGQMCKQDCCWIADSGKQFPHAGDTVVRYCTAVVLMVCRARYGQISPRNNALHALCFEQLDALSKTCLKARSYFQNFRLLGVLN